MLAKATGIPADEIRKGDIGSGDRTWALTTAKTRLRRLPLLVYDAPGQTITDIQLRARVAVRRQKVRLIVIDHLHRIKPAPAMARLSRLDQVAFITEHLKDLARTLGVPILLLAQLSRDAERREDPRPTVADIKYAGEADADNIILLWRPELHMAADPPEPSFKVTAEKAAEMKAAFWSKKDAVRGKAEVIGAKRRFGKVSAAWLNFDGPTTTFSSPAGDDNLQQGFL
jgi:replicative DNA helicase